MSSPYDSSHGAPTSSQPNPPQISSPYSSQPGWSSAILDPSPPTFHYNWSSTGAHASTPAYRTNAQHPRHHSYPFQQSPHWTPAAFSETDSPLPPSYHPLSPGYTYSSTDNNQTSLPGTMETVPPPRDSRRVTPPGSIREHPTSGGVASGNPSMGISRCSSCKVTTSPEWRKGPSGKTDLCNEYVFRFCVLRRIFFSHSRFGISSCGLRYAKSWAKKEGTATQRCRKDKVMALTKQEPSSSGFTSVAPNAVPYNNMRRGSYDDAFLSSSAGSASRNEAYPSESMHSHSNLDLTPSPSPPENSAPLSHYNLQSQGTRQTDSRGHYAVQSGSLYPYPLYHPPLQSQRLSNTPSPLPPLPLVLNRASPILSPTLSDSALSSDIPTSFERDRHREPVTLPQVPLSGPRRVPTNKTTFVTP